jgi:hypothetical protein
VTDRPAARRGPPRHIALAAVILGLDGGALALYGSFLPLFPILIEQRIPDVASLIGVVAIVTAVGVWRLHDWARKLAGAFLVVFLARDVTFAAVGLTSGATQDIVGWAAEGAWIAVDALALFLLARRWPVEAT